MSEENVEVVRRIFEAFSRGDLEGGIELADTPPEFEFVPSGALIPDLASVQRGPEAFRRVVETFFAEFDDPRIDLKELIRVARRRRASQTAKANMPRISSTSWVSWSS